MSQVLLISHIFPPAVDGGSRVIYKLGQYLKSQDHQTLYLSSDCFSTDDFAQPKHKTISPNRQLPSHIYLPISHRFRRPLKFINLFLPKNSYLYGLLKVFQKGPVFKPYSFFKATLRIIKFKPDLIIAGPLPTTAILYANFLKTILNIFTHHRPKLLINASFHQTDSDFSQRPLINTLQQADYLWTLTQYETDFFIKKLHIDPDKIILAGNGIDSSFLKNSKPSGHPNPEPNILFVGSFAAHKGLDILISAFCSLITSGFDSTLTIAGQKTLYYPKIEKIIRSQPQEIRKKIKFIFNFPQNRLTKIIDNCDILVLPSSQESFGLVLLEAWARLKPVITSHIPPLQELVNKTYGGLTFKDRDSNDLAQKIIYLLNSPPKRHQLKQNGFNYVKNNYTWPIVGAKICQKISL